MNSPLAEKHIVVGIGAGIAAYKTPELIRRLRDFGASVRVIMTPAATEFVTPLTLQVTSGYPVANSLWTPHAESGMDHIELGNWADAILIAPTTADLMARLALGLADNLLTTVCLATRALLCLAPAMNPLMWNAPATFTNYDLLKRRGVHFFGPANGAHACGEIGLGRMLEPIELVHAVENIFVPQLFRGQKIVITAGPTREALDPVRFISNRSSGKMGYALAAAATAMGAEVTLISGPTSLPPVRGVEIIAVTSAQEMCQAVLNQLDNCAILIACAAVADFRPRVYSPQKVKKNAAELNLILEPTIDILTQVQLSPKRPFVVGFAAETEQLELHAREKLQRKGMDMIAANWVGENSGFECDDNALEIYWSDGKVSLPRASKQELAYSLLKVIAERFSLHTNF